MWVQVQEPYVEETKTKTSTARCQSTSIRKEIVGAEKHGGSKDEVQPVDEVTKRLSMRYIPTRRRRYKGNVLILSIVVNQLEKQNI